MAQGRSTKIISTIKWIRTSRLSIKKSLSARRHARTRTRPGGPPAFALSKQQASQKKRPVRTTSQSKVEATHAPRGSACFSVFSFRFSGLGSRVSDFVFRVSCFMFRLSGVGFRVSGFGFWGSAPNPEPRDSKQKFKERVARGCL